MSDLRERLLKYSEYGMDNLHNVIASVLDYYGETCQDLASNESLINECAKVIEDSLQSQANARVEELESAIRVDLNSVYAILSKVKRLGVGIKPLQNYIENLDQALEQS